MLGRLVLAADFQRLLGVKPWARSAHFALHHLPVRPLRRSRPHAEPGHAELSTGAQETCPQPVDDRPAGHWLGCVVPKRLARRAVTRNMLRRQIRSAALQHHQLMPRGMWLVRLREGFARAEFPSADSVALRRAARAELDALMLARSRQP